MLSLRKEIRMANQQASDINHPIQPFPSVPDRMHTGQHQVQRRCGTPHRHAIQHFQFPEPGGIMAQPFRPWKLGRKHAVIEFHHESIGVTQRYAPAEPPQMVQPSGIGHFRPVSQPAKSVQQCVEMRSAATEIEIVKRFAGRAAARLAPPVPDP